jgi:hypothetical protein
MGGGGSDPLDLREVARAQIVKIRPSHARYQLQGACGRSSQGRADSFYGSREVTQSPRPRIPDGGSPEFAATILAGRTCGVGGILCLQRRSCGVGPCDVPNRRSKAREERARLCEERMLDTTRQRSKLVNRPPVPAIPCQWLEGYPDYH